MGKRLRVLGAVIALAVLTVGAVPPALGSSDSGSTTARDTDEQTISVIFVPKEVAEIDNGAEGFSLGDDFVFSGNLRQGGERVGRYGVVCTFISTADPDHVEAQCPATATLPGGQITVQGVVVNRSLDVTLPIIGGSGDYEGAEGQLVQRNISTATKIKAALTFHLEG